MRPLSPRVAVAVVLSAVLLITTPALPASAATRPAQVGLVSFVGASLTSSGATLTVDWKDVPGATSYQVFASKSYDGVATKTTPSAVVKTSRAKLTGLARGTDYFVQVRAVNSAGRGYGSPRVGHQTITAQAKLSSTAPRYRLLTWNVCSYICSDFSTRAKVINSRISELKPDIVGLQEASRYTKAPSGYTFAYNGQNDILLRASTFTKVKSNSKGVTSGHAVTASKYTRSGRGFTWAALKHKSGKYILAVDVHLLVGTSGANLRQREYEASRVSPYISRVLARLNKSHGHLTDWTKVAKVVLGDVNSQKSREGDDTLKILEKAGWHDAFDESRLLKRQHHNTANPEWKMKPIIAVKWGAHVDKVLVRPSRSVVYSWENAGEMSGSSYVGPLGSDHHPVLVELSLK